MKKITVLTMIFFVSLFVFIGNACAVSEPPVPYGYSLPSGFSFVTDTSGVYSPKMEIYSEQGDAAWTHILERIDIVNSGQFYLSMLSYEGPTYKSTYTSKSDNQYFQTYTNGTDYIWFIEDGGGDQTWGDGSGDGDHNDFIAWTGAKPIATPVPAAVWLLGSGLVGLVGIRRKAKK